MGTRIKMLVVAGAAAVAATAVPAAAQAVQVYTNQSLFDSQRPGIASHGFSVTGDYQSVSPSYTNSGVTFASSPLYLVNSSYQSLFGATYLDAQDGTTLNVTFAGPVLGLTLGSFIGAETISYVVNGVAGTLNLGARGTTSFIGFDTGSASKTINATFTYTNGELDVINFQTAVPEPATWATMMIGVGAIGATLRRRRGKTTTRVAFA